MASAWAAFMVFAVAVVALLNDGAALTKDGDRYQRMARGEAVPSPYSRRWLLPLVLGPSPLPWQVVGFVSMVAMAVMLGDPVVALAFLLLPGVGRFNMWAPVLVDLPAMALAMASARADSPLVQVALAVLSGACHERGPVFAAIYAWSPLPLVGMIGSRWFAPSAPADEEWLKHPVREAVKRHRGAWMDPVEMVAPWGAMLPLFAMRPTTQGLVALVVGYGQMLVAQDRARLFSWAAPVVVPVAMENCPPWARWVVPFVAMFFGGSGR
jgi:hypothetical protein